MKRTDKEQVVAELVERLRTSSTMIVADYRGLGMTDLDGVRTELLKHGARFSVVKNTLTKRAAEAAGVDELNQFLDGPTAIAFVADGDMVQVAKVLSETARRTRVLALKGGVLDGRAITADQVGDLASLPPADVLRGQVLGAIVGPLNAIVSIFNAPLREFVAVVDARINQLEESGESASHAPEADAAREAADAVDASAAEADLTAAEGNAEPATADAKPAPPDADATPENEENETTEEEE
jgi:large subunit ribosomal protein L10